MSPFFRESKSGSYSPYEDPRYCRRKFLFMTLRSKAFINLIALILLLYVGSFIVLATFGGYTLLPSGKYRPVAGLANADTWVWQPRYGTFHFYLNAAGKEGIIATNLGYLYSPLILATQKILKPPVSMIVENGSSYLIPIEQMHPDFKKLWLGDSNIKAPLFHPR